MSDLIREALEAARGIVWLHAGDDDVEGAAAEGVIALINAALRELDEARPVAWIVEDENFRQLSFDPAFREGTIRTIPLYAAPPDVERLQARVRELEAALVAVRDCTDLHGWGSTVEASDLCDRIHDLTDSYTNANPLGGPASMFETMARRIRAGEDYYAVLQDYGLMKDPSATGEGS